MKTYERPKNLPKQTVVLYDSPRGKGIPFDTGYDDSQVVDALVRCKAHHGERCNARSQVI